MISRARFITDSEYSNEDLAWTRQMMRTYRSDHISMADYKWRYVRFIMDDVPYCSTTHDPSLGSPAQEQVAQGGVCGRCAFLGRLTTRASTQTGHAALSHWTPDGWVICLGTWWSVAYCGPQGGLDFLLESQAREFEDDYQLVRRAQWLADWDLYAVDGHYHKAACFDKKSKNSKGEPRAIATGHFFRMNMRTHHMSCLGMANPEDGVTYTYLTSGNTLPAYQIVLLYKHGWDIEKIFHQFKSKMVERKSWASSLEAKQSHAIFECLAHNLLLLFEQYLSHSEGLRDELEEKNQQGRSKAAARACAATGILRAAGNFINTALQRATQPPSDLSAGYVSGSTNKLPGAIPSPA